MKRDMNLIRLMLLAEESGQEPPDTSEYPVELQLYNLKLADDAGLIDAIMFPEVGIPAQVTIRRLTWAGHDFLDAARDNGVWNKAMEHIIKPGVSWSFSILVEWLKQEARRRLLGDQPSSCDSTSPHVV
jgi:Hypothetical protein (DUF2513)